MQPFTMANEDATFGLDCSLKSFEKETKAIRILSPRSCYRRTKGMVLLIGVISVAALLAVTNPNVVSRIWYYRKIFLKNLGYSTSDEITTSSSTTSPAFGTIKSRKNALRHESNQVAGRQRMLSLSDYSDPKSMDNKGTSTASDAFGTNNEVLNQGFQGALYDGNANQMGMDSAQSSTGTYTPSGNIKHTEQQQQSFSQTTMRIDGSTSNDATENDISPSNYATGNTPNVEMQQWQPSSLETTQQQQQQQLTLGGELDGEMSTRYASSEYEIDHKANAGTSSSETASLTPNQQTNYQLVEAQQQPSSFGEPISDTKRYGDTSMNMKTQQQGQQPALSGSMQVLNTALPSNNNGGSLMSLEAEQQLLQERTNPVFPPPPEEEEMIADKTPLIVNDRFSSPSKVEINQEGPIQQWQSYQEGSQLQAVAKTTSETISSVSSTPGFISSAVKQTDKNLQIGESSKMPSSFDNVANFPSSMEPGDIAVLWNIPKGGTTAINDILAGCLQLAVANNVGAQFGHSDDQNLQVFEQHGARFVNVETFTLDGLAKAKKLHLTSSGLVDAMVVYYVHEASELFTPTHRGFFFTMMRDPIERTLLLIRSKRDDPAFASMSIKEFAQSGALSTNWMTRWLSNQPTGALSEEDLKFAKNILRTKFVIGIYEKMEKSLEHFEKYFGWKVLGNSHREKCVRDHISDNVLNNDVSMDMPSKDSNEYIMLLDLNHFDIELYRYAKILFMEQAGYFGKISRPIFGQ